MHKKSDDYRVIIEVLELKSKTKKVLVLQKKKNNLRLKMHLNILKGVLIE